MNAADIAWGQIPTMTKMACGARQPMHSDDGNKLTFKVGKRLLWIEVTYLEADDLYKVELVRVSRIKYERIIEESHEGVDAGALGSVVYGAVNK